ncbi:MAG: HrpE/YscL family type III secretion apparatus protein [Kiritimatiellae bacterium]|nr:HrpE/YscL family type III secretion apparatus protein [Kiritimatiellia bacterium]
MLLVKKQSFELSSSARLVKATDVQTVCDAQSVIAAAEAEAARLVEAAKAAYEEERRQGYAKGLAAVQAEVARRKLELADESAVFMASVEEKMGDIVMKALRKCVDEIGDRELIVQVVRKVMKAVVRNQRQITLRVAPDMVETVRSRMSDILADFPLLDEVDVQEDARLKGTACAVETAAGIADASIDTQLAAVEESIRRRFSRES